MNAIYKVDQDYSLGPLYPHLNQPYPLLRHVLSLHPDGYALEFGVEKGLSLGMIAATMPVVGFDSFRGLPEDWRPGYPKGALAHRRPHVTNARIIAGWFADTLPRFNFARVTPIGLVHIDCDLYSSATTALNYVGPHMEAGCIIVFDEYHGYDGAELHEERAWREYVERTGVTWDVLGHSEQSWAVRLT